MATSRTYRTFGDALQDPASAIARFVAESEAAMLHNPQGPEEWTAYLAWQAKRTRGADMTTKAWREESCR